MSVIASSYWFTRVCRLGTTPNSYALPTSFKCPICASTIIAYPDAGYTDVWLYCPSCQFAGGIALLESTVNKVIPPAVDGGLVYSQRAQTLIRDCSTTPTSSVLPYNTPMQDLPERCFDHIREVESADLRRIVLNHQRLPSDGRRVTVIPASDRPGRITGFYCFEVGEWFTLQGWNPCNVKIAMWTDGLLGHTSVPNMLVAVTDPIIAATLHVRHRRVEDTSLPLILVNGTADMCPFLDKPVIWSPYRAAIDLRLAYRWSCKIANLYEPSRTTQPPSWIRYEPLALIRRANAHSSYWVDHAYRQLSGRNNVDAEPVVRAWTYRDLPYDNRRRRSTVRDRVRRIVDRTRWGQRTYLVDGRAIVQTDNGWTMGSGRLVLNLLLNFEREVILPDKRVYVGAIKYEDKVHPIVWHTDTGMTDTEYLTRICNELKIDLQCKLRKGTDLVAIAKAFHIPEREYADELYGISGQLTGFQFPNCLITRDGTMIGMRSTDVSATIPGLNFQAVAAPQCRLTTLARIPEAVEFIGFVLAACFGLVVSPGRRYMISTKPAQLPYNKALLESIGCPIITPDQDYPYRWCGYSLDRVSDNVITLVGQLNGAVCALNDKWSVFDSGGDLANCSEVLPWIGNCIPMFLRDVALRNFLLPIPFSVESMTRDFQDWLGRVTGVRIFLRTPDTSLEARINHVVYRALGIRRRTVSERHGLPVTRLLNILAERGAHDVTESQILGWCGRFIEYKDGEAWITTIER